jgi:hypothetical protein
MTKFVTALTEVIGAQTMSLERYASMTWIALFEATKSAETTFTESIITPEIASLVAFAPFRISTSNFFPAMSPDITLPGRKG